MQVAFLTPILPWPANTGGTLRTYHLLRGLAERHQVDLFSFHYGSPPDTGPLAPLCRRVIPIALGDRYRRHRQLLDLLGPQPRSVTYFATATARATMARYFNTGAERYDLIVCDEIMMTPYLERGWLENSSFYPSPNYRSQPDLTFDREKQIPTLLLRPKIDHRHYAEMAAERPMGGAKLLDWIEARRLQRYEAQILPRYTGVVVCSPEDQQITAAQCASLPVTVIPNGADIGYFQPIRQPDPVPTILLMGTMHYYPNIDGVRYFMDAIYPPLREQVPDLQLLIVGHHPPPEIVAWGQQPGITVTGSVEDVRPYMARSWVMAVPLRLGGGTRLKITEAFAAGLPVVSTSIGAQGLEATDGRHLLLADDAPTFVTALSRILTTPTLAEELAGAGRMLVERTYSWQALGERFATICEQTAAS